MSISNPDTSLGSSPGTISTRNSSSIPNNNNNNNTLSTTRQPSSPSSIGSPSVPPREGFGNFSPSGIASRYGGYGSYYGGSPPYNGYGGYGSYGAYGNRYGVYNNRGPRPLNWVDNGYNSIGYLQSMTDSFARFAELLGANADALHSSFASILGLMEIFTQLAREIGVIISGIAFFRFLKKIFMRMFGVKELSVSEFERSNNNNNNRTNIRKGFSWFSVLIVVVVVAIGVPIMRLVWSRLVQIVKENDDEDPVENNPSAVVLFDYNPQRQEDLTLQKGDVLKILEKPFRYWWVAEIQSGPRSGCRGLVPANYLNVTNNKSNTKRGEPEQVETEQNSGSPTGQTQQQQPPQTQSSPASSQQQSQTQSSPVSSQQQSQQLQRMRQSNRQGSGGGGYASSSSTTPISLTPTPASYYPPPSNNRYNNYRSYLGGPPPSTEYGPFRNPYYYGGDYGQEVW